MEIINTGVCILLICIGVKELLSGVTALMKELKK